jgi:hypothetical protein
MPRYLWECHICGSQRTVISTVEDRDAPQFCCHRQVRGQTVMKRLFGSFQFIGCREVDRPENNLARVVTRSNDPQDWLEWTRKDMARADIQSAKIEASRDVSGDNFTMDDLDISGCWTAAKAGPEQLQRWRDDNIGPDDLASEEVGDGSF